MTSVNNGDIVCPLESIEIAMAFHVRDWTNHHRDAWIYGIVKGFDDESMKQMQDKHNWSNETVNRLKALHVKWKQIKTGEI